MDKLETKPMEMRYNSHTGYYIVPLDNYGIIWTYSGLTQPMQDWMDANMKGKWSFIIVKVVALLSIKDPEDAMLFKLRWC